MQVAAYARLANPVLAQWSGSVISSGATTGHRLSVRRTCNRAKVRILLRCLEIKILALKLLARISAGVLDDGGFLAKVLAQRPRGAHGRADRRPGASVSRRARGHQSLLGLCAGHRFPHRPRLDERDERCELDSVIDGPSL